MGFQIARRMQHVRRSFVRDILKAAARPEVISFAGGLPNPRLIPVARIAQAAAQILDQQGSAALQYCATEGHLPLRQWIADEYRRAGVAVGPENILITTGSQQGFDLIGKTLVDPGDRVILEDPTYIAALQAFAIVEAEFAPVEMDEHGMRPDALQRELHTGAKIVYSMPNFQNPTGKSYSAARRQEIAQILSDSPAVLVEDDPYGRLRFRGEELPPIARHLAGRSLLLGSFSKFVAPGLRLGWICAPMELMEKLIIAKQAVDLHSENLGQWIVHRIVTSPDFPDYLAALRENYGRQCRHMIAELENHFPPEVRLTRPDGGMFVWMTFPAPTSTTRLFERAIERGVAFVPGEAFFAHPGRGANMLRLNFSNCEESRITAGVQRLAEAWKQLSE
jgi:2-aminoadipate transaminase